MNDISIDLVSTESKKITGCLGYYDEMNGDYDCEYDTSISCEDCKYGGCGGRKDPDAKCNQINN
jgi:hypothetical protein